MYSLDPNDRYGCTVTQGTLRSIVDCGMVALPPDYDNGEARGKWNGGGLKLEDPSQPHKPLSPIVCTSYISNGEPI